MEENVFGNRWQVRTLADAYEDRPPIKYIVDKFFAEASLSVVYGAPGCLKSMVLADMFCAILSGNDWLPGSAGGRFGVECYKSDEAFGALWIDLDNGKRRTDDRFGALGKGHKLDKESPLYYVSMPVNPALDLNNAEAIMEIKGLVWQSRAKIVVIDNLGLITGDTEENSAGMTAIMGDLRKIAEDTNVALIVIHHQRKGGANGSRAGDALRGHSSIEAALDLAIHVTREPGGNDITLTSTKTRGVDVPTVRASFYYVHKTGTNDLDLAYFYGVQSGPEDSIKKAIIDYLEKHGDTTKGRLVDAVREENGNKWGVNKVRNWIEEMVMVTKELVIETGEKNAKIVRHVG